MLKANRMATNIRRLTSILKKRRLVVDKSVWILKEAASYVQTCPPDQWELVISPERSLEFVQAEADDRLKPDIFCLIKTENKGDWPISHLSLVLRVWSIRQNVSFRPDWDPEHLKNKFDEMGSYKRVIFRCHCDSCNQEQYAPIFHLQFGGKPQENEFYWFPHYVELPRFISPPIDLVLACELVVATFFPSVYTKLCQDSVWRSIIKESEMSFMSTYYKTCKNYFTPSPMEKTLLDHLSSFMVGIG